MTTMVERVARVLNPLAFEWSDDPHLAVHRKMAMAQARAAIEVMLEPDMMMEMRASQLRLPVRLDQIRDLYRTMIKEAAK